jgi:hypothetical protein
MHTKIDPHVSFFMVFLPWKTPDASGCQYRAKFAFVATTISTVTNVTTVTAVIV